MKKMLLSAVALFILTATSCKKDKVEDDEPQDVTPTVATLSGTYKITAVTANNINVWDNSNANFNAFQACEKDDQYKLNSNLTYEVIDAGTVCSPSNNDTGTWSLTGTTINIDGQTGTITSFNGKKLVVSSSFQGSTVVTTYEKV